MSTFEIYRYYNEYTAGSQSHVIDVTGRNDFYWTGGFDYWTYDENDHLYFKWRYRMDNWGNIVISEVNMDVDAPTIFAGDDAIIANNYSSYGYEYIYADKAIALESLSVEDGAEFRVYAELKSTNIDIAGELYVQGTTKTNSMTVTGSAWLGDALIADGAENAMLEGTGTIVFLNNCSLGANIESTDKFTIGEGLTLVTAVAYGGLDAVFYADIVNNGSIISVGRNLNVTGQADGLLELKNHNLIEAGESTIKLSYVKLDNTASARLNASGANLYFGEGTQVTNGVLTGEHLNVSGATQMSGVTVDAEGVMAVGNVLTLKDSFTVNGTVQASDGSLVASGTAKLGGSGTITFLSSSSLGDSDYASGAFTIGENLTLKTAVAYGGFDAKFYADIVNNGSIISVGRNLNVTGQSSENLLELKNNNLIETRSSTMNLINVKLDNAVDARLNASGANLYFGEGTQVANGILTGEHLNVRGATQMSGVTVDAEGAMTVGNVLTLKDSFTVNGTVQASDGSLVASGTAKLGGSGTITFLSSSSLGDSDYASGAFTIGENLTLKTAVAYGGFDAKFYADIVNNGSIISNGRNLNVTGQSLENLLELKNNNLIETRSSTMNLTNVKLDNAVDARLNASGANLYFDTGTQVTNGILTGEYLYVSGTTRMSGVTVDAEGVMTVGNVLTLKDSFTVNGTVKAFNGSLVADGTTELEGSGTITFLSSSSLGDSDYASGAFTIGKNLTLKSAVAYGGNDAVFYADIVNNGTILSDGRNLNVTGQSENARLKLENNGLISIGLSPSTLRLSNVALDNTRGIVQGQRDTIEIKNSTVNGGLLTGDTIRFSSSNSISAVTITGSAKVSVANGDLSVEDTITLNGKMEVSEAQLLNSNTEQASKIEGMGTVVFLKNSSLGDQNYTSGAFTIGENLTLKTSLAYGGNDPRFYADIVNKGSILSDGRTLHITGQSSENLLELDNSNLLETRSSQMNLANVRLANTSEARLNASGANMNFGTGTQITDGILTGEYLNVTGATWMTGVTVDAEGIMTVGNVLTLKDTFTVEGTVQASGGTLVAEGTNTELLGSGTLSFLSNCSLGDNAYTSGTFTIGKNLTLKTSLAYGGNDPRFYADIVNNGSIISDGRTLYVTGQTDRKLALSNKGTIEAKSTRINFTQVEMDNSGGVLDGGANGLYFNDSRLFGSNTTISGTLEFNATSNILLEKLVLDGATLSLSGSAVISDLSGKGGTIAVQNGGSLTLNDAKFTENTNIVNNGGTLTLSGLCGFYTLNLKNTQNAILTGNDFTNATFQISGNNALDLSGNYWNGLSDVEEIRSKWNLGNNVVINDVLDIPAGKFYLMGDNLNSSYLPNGKDLELAFSRPLDSTTLEGNIFIEEKATGRTIQLTADDWSLEGSVLTVNASVFDSKRTWRIRLGEGIRDISGNTLPASDRAGRDVIIDNSGCSVADVSLKGVCNSGNTGLTEMIVTFTGNIDPATLVDAVTIVGPNGNSIKPVSAELLTSSIAKIHLQPLTATGKYTVHVNETAADFAGNALNAAWQSEFEINTVNLEAEITSSPSQAFSGQSIDVTWETSNAEGAAFASEWSDGIYLSADDKWDINDTRIGTLRHAGLEAGQTISSTMPVTVNASEGNYYLLVRPDDQFELGSGGTPRSIATRKITLSTQELHAGEAGLCQCESESFFYYKVTQDANSTLNLNWNFNNSQVASIAEMYVSYDEMPTFNRNDYFLQGTRNDSLSLTLPATSVQRTAYIMIHTSTAGTTSGTLNVSDVPLSITKVLGERSNDTDSTIVVTGVDFTPDMTVTLKDANGNTYTPNEVTFINSNKVALLFEANTLPAGTYAISADANGEHAELEDALTITQKSDVQISVSIDAPARIGYHMISTIPVTVTASGQGDTDSPLIVVVPYSAVPDGNGGSTLSAGGILTTDKTKVNYGFWTSTMPEGFSHAVVFSASGTQAGRFSAGESVQCDVYYTGWVQPWDMSYPSIQWSYAVITPEDTTPIDWNAIFEDGDMDPALKEYLASAMAKSIGATFGDYVRVSNRNLVAMSNAGIQEPNTIALETLRAIGYNSPLRILASEKSSTDLSVGKLALSVERNCRSDLVSRYEAGSFGYNWTCNWDASLSIESTGDITAYFGGSARTYKKGFDGLLRNNDGDGSTLKAYYGKYILTERDGTAYTFSNTGVLLSVADSAGNTISCTYANGLLTGLSGSNGAKIMLTRNDAGYIARIDGSDGSWATFEYSAQGDLIATEDSSGVSINYTYDDTHALLSMQNSQGTVGTYGYDQETRLLNAVSLDGKELSIAYEADGTVVIEDSRGNTSSYLYDDAGRLVSVMDGGTGLAWNYSYDAQGNMLSAGDNVHGTTYAFYDDMNRIRLYVAPTGEEERYSYNEQGDLAQIRDERGNTISLSYDNRRNVTAMAYSNGATVSFDYNYNENTVSYTNSAGNLIVVRCNELDAPVSVTIGNRTSTIQYDGAGNLTGFELPNGLGGNSYIYDSFNRPAIIRDANGNGVSYAWNEFNKVASIEFADGTREAFTYDALGNLETWTTRGGATINYSLDEYGSLCRQSLSDGRVYEYAYDNAGRLVSAGDISIAYTPGNALSSLNWADGRRVSFEYDQTENNVTAVQINGQDIELAYTQYGDIAAVTAGAFSLENDFGFFGENTQTVFGNQAEVLYQYDTSLLLTGISASNGFSESYSFDEFGNLACKAVSGGVWNYTYDAANRLLSEQFTANSNPDEVLDSRAYTYDLAGNRLTTTINGTSVQTEYDELNRIVRAGDVDFTYDANGNLLSDGVRAYTWTADNRILTETILSTGTTRTVEYDAFGNRSNVTYDNGVTVKYTIDVDGMLFASESTDGTKRTYVLGDGGQIAGFLDENDNAYYFVTDRLGSVISVLDETGNAVNSYSYDAWGNIIDSTVTVKNELTYLGAYGVLTNDSGTYTIKARDYDPVTGRWLSADPAGSAVGPNLYQYCRDNALAYIDLTGNDAISTYKTVENAFKAYKTYSPYAKGYKKAKSYGDTFNSWAEEYYNNNSQVSSKLSRDAFIDVFTTIANTASPTGKGMINQTGGFVKRLSSGIEYKTIWFTNTPDVHNMRAQFADHDLWEMSELLYNASLEKDPQKVKDIVNFTKFMMERGITNDQQIKNLYLKLSTVSGSMDPNDKLVSPGAGENGYIAGDQTLTYTIRFENDPEKADAPVRWLRIFDTLDDNLDINTFSLLSYNLAGNFFTVDGNRSSYSEKVVVEINGVSVTVDVSIALDRETRQISAVFTALDPETGIMLQDIDKGFLYPNDESGRGDGQIVYSIAALPNLETGTTIRNTADIYFDFNEPMSTPTTLNTIDADAPGVASLALSMDGEGLITLDMSAEDVGAGIAGFNIRWSTDGEHFSDYGYTTYTQLQLPGRSGMTYYFQIQAVDVVGLTSEWTEIQSLTFIGTPTELEGNAMGLSWKAVDGAESYVVEYSTDAFEHFVRIQVIGTSLDSFSLPQASYQWRVRAAESDDWEYGEEIVASEQVQTPQLVQSNEDGALDLFFAHKYDTWNGNYLAQHTGLLNGWNGTDETSPLDGKNMITDVFHGSTDRNLLYLTDDANGDALFVDDIYSELPGTLEEQQARIARINEIRAGIGNDIIDLTSQRFDYVGNGMTVRGGLGDDIIWANTGNNWLFGDAGNDRIVGASGNDVIVGGAGNDSMHGGGGDDIFAFGGNWGDDVVEQLEDGKVTLWFDEGSLDKWDASTLTYRDGDKSVVVNGVAAENITLKFGDDGSEQYGKLLADGAFDEYSSERIFENKNSRGMLA